MSSVTVLSAGAGESLVRAVREQDPTADVVASFGPVGAIAERLRGGEHCDLFISSDRGMQELIEAGELDATSVRDLGWVPTGLAVRTDDTVPDVSSAEALQEVVRGARVLFFPDPVKSTAGAHFSGVLQDIGRSGRIGDDLSTHPNGATAMRALAAHDGSAPVLGCTQVTEILQVEGVELAGPLPAPYDLDTRYQCALLGHAVDPESAGALHDALTGAGSSSLREALGFVQRE